MQSRVKFFRDSFMLIARTPENKEPDVERIYAFWRMNLDKIDALLVRAMQNIAASQTGGQDSMATAGTIANLGKLMEEFPFGNRAINLEVAIASHQICAKILTRDEYPELWAMFQHILGNTYHLKRIEGNRKENIEQAIHAYRLALEVYTQKYSPLEWADIQTALDTACQYLDALAMEAEKGNGR
jgi:hypothetical protein